MRSLSTVPPAVALLPDAAPFCLEAHGPEGVLLLHGFTGDPDEMRYLADSIHDRGYTVSVPRLPGHGTTGSDFRTTGHRDWWRRAIDAYLELAQRCPRVHLMGLSMGGVLATLLAAQFPARSLALFAPAFKVYDRRIALTPFMRFVLRPRRLSTGIEEPNESRRRMREEYWDVEWPEQTAHLLRLMRRGRRALSGLSGPVLTVVSQADRVVPADVAELIVARAGAAHHRVLRLTESEHVVVDGSERETVADATVEWLARNADS